jgi:hypothetical protein
MRRLTRRIGLFGGPGAIMPAMGVPKKPTPKPQPETAPAPEATPAAEPKTEPKTKTKSFFARLLGSEDE